MTTKPPISWYGGKARLAKVIIPLIPKDTTVFVEGFGGGGRVVFGKEPSQLDIYNDLNGDLVNFYRVLRDRPEELQRALVLTPYAKHEFDLCSEKMRTGDTIDPVERARIFFTALMQSYGSTFQGWNRTTKGRKDRRLARSVTAWLNAIDKRLPAAVKRLRMIQIEHADFREVIERYDNPGVVFYLDPPYVHGTRGEGAKGKYAHEMSNADHADLVGMIIRLKGRAILSGYDNPIYAPLLKHGITQVDLGETNISVSGKTGKGKDREFLWLKGIDYE